MDISKKKLQQSISNASIVKFEYNGCNEYIEISNLNSLGVLYTQQLIEIDNSVGNWIYRLTYDSKDIKPKNEEFVVEIGEKALSINGFTYCYSSQQDYDNWLKTVRIIYEKLGFDLEN